MGWITDATDRCLWTATGLALVEAPDGRQQAGRFEGRRQQHLEQSPAVGNDDRGFVLIIALSVCTEALTDAVPTPQLQPGSSGNTVHCEMAS